ncbi:MAG: hypothetical protein GWP05_05355 [Anaerolineaceae bacterium]|nr:hypothetical protein [Anaerolineaceae bacterium]
MEAQEHDGTRLPPQSSAPHPQGTNLLRVARVILVLVVAMAAGVGICYAMMPEARPIVRPELRQPAAIFPAGMAALRRWRYIVLHHTATEVGDVERIDRYHRQRLNWKKGIGYHFLIGNGDGMPDGRLEYTSRWKNQETGAHAFVKKPLPTLKDFQGSMAYNQYGIGIALVGNFNHGRPTRKQMDTLTEAVYVLCDRFGIPLTRVYLHKDLVATDCPGREFPAGELFRRLGEKFRNRLQD